jgi:uncharacterized protein (TIGR03492 family)
MIDRSAARTAAPVLFLSNGHGEDDIAGKIIDRLRRDAPGLSIHGWPMMGHGAAYRDRGIPLTGRPAHLPSAGFGTLNLSLFWRDLRAGWLSALGGQMRAARGLRAQYQLAVAVGDIVVIAAAVLARLPFLFVASAKSGYYGGTTGYNWLEKTLLRRCLLAFPRDLPTADVLKRAGVPSRYVGNPIMDDLEGTDETFGLPPGQSVVGLLPGSRSDLHDNVITLLAAAAATAEGTPGAPLCFLFAAPAVLDPGEVRRRVREEGRAPGWREEAAGLDDPQRGIVLKLAHVQGPRAWIVQGWFADVLRRSAVVVGVAGTANEQAVGLGRPLITFPTQVQGGRFVRMKMQLFDGAALEVPPRPDAVAAALLALLRDPDRMVRMGAIGRQRMGPPGASSAIAETVRAALSGGDQA